MSIASEWPGKSDEQGRRHPAIWHMLDVAAVAERLVCVGPLVRLTAAQRRAVVFLIALHDCGKLSLIFRDQIERGVKPLEHLRHWRLSHVVLSHHDARIATILGGDEEARRLFYLAVAGHHGQPVISDMGQQGRDQRTHIGHEGLAAAGDLIDAMARLFPGASLNGIDEMEARRLSWGVSGLTVMADWVGSNSIWFPFTGPDVAVDDYWHRARRQADHALQQAGMLQSSPTSVSARSLVGVDLRPMQATVADLSLPDGPCLAVIEDATGAGKTEAALILAQRMMAAGKAGGVYFALPTMATSDAMFARLRPMLRRMFDGAPSLALSHGKRALSDGFAEVRGNAGDAPNDAACASWIADDRRLSLLAEIGVGTIDQALLAVLPTRFNTLRLAALAGRVLVVDEAHSYDPYMEVQLRMLLRFHAMMGGSAIVMTATLPKAMRAGLVDAFSAGAGLSPQQPPIEAYPALTLVGRAGGSQAVAPVPATCRRLEVNRLADADAAVTLVAASARLGAACLWVRNAVDDAIEAVERLRAEGIEADLLHARFAMADRLAIEAVASARFGRTGTGREGRVLVATQVVESSLDFDFDLMVSDLAPVGALIQRAGRLWRHMDLRPATGRPVPGPILHVLSPDPDDVVDTRWIHKVLGSGAWVYPQDVMWRTARAVLDTGAIVAPEGLRALIEAVHGDGLLPLPAALERVEIETIGRADAEAGQARRSVLSPVRGFDFENVFDDVLYPTRLGEEQVTLVLARRGPFGLVPWAEDARHLRALALSEVQVSRKRFAKITLPPVSAEIEDMVRHWKEWERATKFVLVVEEDGCIAEGLRYDVMRGLVLEPRRE